MVIESGANGGTTTSSTIVSETTVTVMADGVPLLWPAGGGGQSASEKTGIGVGVGLGVPLLALALVIAWLFSRVRRSKLDEAVASSDHAQTQGYQEADGSPLFEIEANRYQPWPRSELPGESVQRRY